MKRILIYSSRSLFSEGVKNLLDAERGLDVIGWVTDREEAIQQIRELQPDAVLLINDGSLAYPLVLGQRLFRAGGATKIVELSLEDNNVCVYHGEQRTISEIGDLVSAIEHSVGSAPTPPMSSDAPT